MPIKVWGEITYPLYRWSLGIGKSFQPTLYNECHYLSMLGLNSMLVKRTPDDFPASGLRQKRLHSCSWCCTKHHKMGGNTLNDKCISLAYAIVAAADAVTSNRLHAISNKKTDAVVSVIMPHELHCSNNMSRYSPSSCRTTMFFVNRNVSSCITCSIEMAHWSIYLNTGSPDRFLELSWAIL